MTPDKVRIRTGHVGGSFGMKGSIYPEYLCLAHAARALGRPVKWTDERSGSFLSDQHGRDHEMTAELALAKDGKFLALRVTGYGNMGAYLATMGPQPPTMNVVRNCCSVYAIPLLEVSTKTVFTNTSPVGPYRGAGRPEANYYMERLIDTAAREMGIDRLELRRRNHIKPSEIPYKNTAQMTIDSGDFGALFEKALKEADVGNFPERKRQSKAKGKLRGLGNRQLPRGDRAAEQGDGRNMKAGSRGASRSLSSPARSTTARGTPRRSRRCSPLAWGSHLNLFS